MFFIVFCTKSSKPSVYFAFTTYIKIWTGHISSARYHTWLRATTQVYTIMKLDACKSEIISINSRPDSNPSTLSAKKKNEMNLWTVKTS